MQRFKVKGRCRGNQPKNDGNSRQLVGNFLLLSKGEEGQPRLLPLCHRPAGLPSRSATLDPETCSVPTSSRTERRTSVPPARRGWRCFATARLSRPLMQASAAACAIERHVGITQLRLACSKPVNSQSSNNTGFAVASNYNGLRQVGTRFIRSPVGSDPHERLGRRKDVLVEHAQSKQFRCSRCHSEKDKTNKIGRTT